MDNYLFNKKYQEKADNQLVLIENLKLKIRKNLYRMYFLYLNRLRSEIFNYINKAISSLRESDTLNNLSKKEIISLIVNDINPLIYERMPFITIEQLTLTQYYLKNKSLSLHYSPEKDLDLVIKSSYKKDNKTYSLNIYSECQYYKFSEEYELNSSIDLDDFNFEYKNLFDYNKIIDEPLSHTSNNENIVNGSLINLDVLNNDQENYNNTQIFDEISNILNWSECLDFSLSCQLKKITNEVNSILFFNKIIKKKISYEFLDYVSDNNFLIKNPFPFVNLFDFNNKDLIDLNDFERNADYSKIYFFNLNITEIEFFDMNLNIIRNKINDLKYQLHLLNKKEKYWNNKRLYAKTNKSIINKI